MTSEKTVPERWPNQHTNSPLCWSHYEPTGMFYMTLKKIVRPLHCTMHNWNSISFLIDSWKTNMYSLEKFFLNSVCSLYTKRFLCIYSKFNFPHGSVLGFFLLDILGLPRSQNIHQLTRFGFFILSTQN